MNTGTFWQQLSVVLRISMTFYSEDLLISEKCFQVTVAWTSSETSCILVSYLVSFDHLGNDF